MWEQLAAEVVPALLEDRAEDETLRVWVPGCATGEEAYSYAILLLDAMRERGAQCRLQIYATDIDDRARREASLGVYPRNAVADLGEERVHRYFVTRDGQHLQVSKVLREAIVFAPHDLVEDPPFSRIDLVSCRNLLIYLKAEVQQRVIRRLHFSLRKGGYLVLGAAESIGPYPDYFESSSERWRIYRRAARMVSGEAGREKRIAGDPPRARRERLPRTRDLEGLTRDLLAEHLQLGAVLVDARARVVYLRGDMSRYLRYPEGHFRGDLLNLLQPSLKNRVRRGLRAVLEKGEAVTVQASPRVVEGHQSHLRVTLRPAPHDSGHEPLVLVVFEERPPLPRTERPTPKRPAGDDYESVVRNLEDELQRSREELQGSVEELASSNEELKIANEEVLSVNEELQSSNEELETSKEELQSLNEELRTLNLELKEKMSELSAANDDLDNLLSNVDVPTLFLDADLRVQRYTPAATRLFKLGASALGCPLSELSVEFHDPALEGDARSVLRDHRSFEKEVNGPGNRWYARRLAPYHTQERQVAGVVLTVLEVTDSKRAQRSAEESLLFFRTLGENIPYGVWMCDEVGRTQYVSESFLALTGKTLEEVRRTGWHDLLPPGESEAMRAAWENCVECLCEWEQEFRLPTVDGSFRSILSVGRPVADEEGRIRGWVGLNLDITDREVAERRHADANFRLKLALEAAALGTHDLDVATGQLQFDARGKRIFGLPPDEEINLEQFWERIVPAHRRQVREAVEASLDPTSRPSFRADYQIHPANNPRALRWIRATGRAVFSEVEGEPVAVRLVGTVLDVSRERAEEAALRRARHEAEQANRAKSAFLANMSHDIRTPLTSVIGYAELLGQSAQGEEREMVDRINTACHHLLATLDSVLNLARLERKTTELELSEQVIGPAVREACELLTERAREKHIDLSLHLPAEEIHARIDRGAFCRVVMNLVDNAIKYSPRDSSVRVILTASSREAHLEIADEGKGMSEAFRAKLFEPFSQEREKQPGAIGGSGLGMAISKQLVDLMGGRLEVQSTEDKGTTVRLHFSRIFGEAASIPATPPREEAGSRSDPEGKPRILVCDDYAHTRSILKVMLKHYPVDFASNATELFAKANEQDVILLDINLDGRDVGTELLQRLRAEGKAAGSRVIAFTAHSLPGQRERFIDLGFDGYLSKPFLREDLMRVIHPPT
ncbi:MAG: CheR family methyltransferase, partial [Verrucomicrobiota bacterium]